MNGNRRVDQPTGMWSRASTLVGGALLIGLGVVLLAVNTFGMRLPFEFSSIGWPVFVIAPGIALLIVGLIASGEAGIGLAVAGGIVTTVGLIVAYQSATSHWTSWAYAWALIAPTSVGASMFFWGVVHRRGDTVRQGLSGLGVGLVLFTVGFAFFEGVLNLGGARGLAPLGRQALPVALIGAGVLVILSRLWPAPKTLGRGQPGWGTWGTWGPQGHQADATPEFTSPAGPPPTAPQAGPPPAGSSSGGVAHAGPPAGPTAWSPGGTTSAPTDPPTETTTDNR